MIHYIVWATPPDQLGATKLAKILWFTDVEHYRATGRTVSGSDNYQKRKQGPLHLDFSAAIGRLKAAGAIAERRAPTPVGVRREFVWLQKPDMTAFNGQELATLHGVMDQLASMTAQQASELSHAEPWESAYDGELLPVAAAAVQFGIVEDDDMAWAEREFHAVRSPA